MEKPGRHPVIRRPPPKPRKRTPGRTMIDAFNLANDRFSDPADGSYPHLIRGICVSNADPKKMGRIRVHIPSLYGVRLPENLESLPWAFPVLPHGGTSNTYSFSIPVEKSTVWVMFECGDVDHPVYFGSWIAPVDVPPDVYENGRPALDFIYSRDDVRITSRRDGKLLEVSLGSGIKISQTPDKTVVLHGPSTLELSEGTISATIGGSSLSLTPASADITSPVISLTGMVSISAGGMGGLSSSVFSVASVALSSASGELPGLGDLAESSTSVLPTETFEDKIGPYTSDLGEQKGVLENKIFEISPPPTSSPTDPTALSNRGEYAQSKLLSSGLESSMRSSGEEEADVFSRLSASLVPLLPSAVPPQLRIPATSLKSELQGLDLLSLPSVSQLIFSLNSFTSAFSTFLSANPGSPYKASATKALNLARLARSTAALRVSALGLSSAISTMGERFINNTPFSPFPESSLPFSYPTARIENVQPSGVVDNQNKDFTVSPFFPDSLTLKINGVTSTAFSITGEFSFSLKKAPKNGTEIRVSYNPLPQPVVPDTFVFNADLSPLPNGSNHIFELPSNPDPDSLQVFLEGVLQRRNSSYSLNGKVVNFTLPPAAGKWLTSSYKILN